MLRIGFVVTPGFPVMGLAALSVFEFANLSLPQPGYEVVMLSEGGGPVPSSMGAVITSEPFGDAAFDTLIIGGNTHYVPTSPALCAFVTAAAPDTRRIASICTGVFALADAGLLDGRRVTTHWLFTDQLQAHRPAIRLEAEKIYVKDGPIWTAAGNSAGIDLALAMLEQDAGAALALTVARILVVDHRRAGGQSQRSTLLELTPKSDRIQTALAHARANLRAPLAIEELAAVAGLGPRQFSCIFRTETGVSPARAIESLRLEAARLLIEQTRHPVHVIASETGFGDQERMRRAFVRAFGRPPQAMRTAARDTPSPTA